MEPVVRQKACMKRGEVGRYRGADRFIVSGEAIDAVRTRLMAGLGSNDD